MHDFTEFLFVLQKIKVIVVRIVKIGIPLITISIDTREEMVIGVWILIIFFSIKFSQVPLLVHPVSPLLFKLVEIPFLCTLSSPLDLSGTHTISFQVAVSEWILVILLASSSVDWRWSEEVRHEIVRPSFVGRWRWWWSSLSVIWTAIAIRLGKLSCARHHVIMSSKLGTIATTLRTRTRRMRRMSPCFNLGWGFETHCVNSDVDHRGHNHRFQHLYFILKVKANGLL